MDPSAVRDRILQDHRTLRGRLRELEEAVIAFHADVSRRFNLAELARGTLTALIAHTEAEDAILAPALRDIDAWGHVRARLLLDEHARQRSELRRLIESYRSSFQAERLVELTLEWINDILADMAHEEATVLSAALLRDDPIAVGMESG